MKFSAIILFILFFSLQIFAQEDEPIPISYRGYVKSFMLINDLPSSDDLSGTADNVVRLRLFYEPKDYLVFEAAYQMEPVIHDTTMPSFLNVMSPSINKYRLVDFESNLYDKENSNVRILHNLDRFNMTLTLPFMDIYVGRQPISFGSAKFINPTDVFSPFSFQELNREEKFGVDAIRAKIPVGEMSELDFGYVVGKEFSLDKSAFFARGRFYMYDTDIMLITMDYRHNLLLGMSLARNIIDAGFWLETAYVFDGVFKNRVADYDFFRISTGIDYNFSWGLYTFIEYHFSNAGQMDPEDYMKNNRLAYEGVVFNEGKPAYTEGGVYLQGEQYLMPGISYEIIPLLNGTMQMIFNMLDFSVFISPKLEYNIKQDCFIDIGAFISFGKEAKMTGPTISGYTPQSEFGMYPNMFFMNLRYYY